MTDKLNDDGPLSDDEVYDGVDLISDSDDDDPDTIERAEEQNIISSEEEDDVVAEAVSSVTRSDLPGQDGDASDWEGFGLDDADSHAQMNSYFESEIEVGNAASALDPVLGRAVSEVVSEGKRVRFHEEVLYSASISSVGDSSDDGDQFGGLFIQQDELHPRFRSLIENDRDDDDDDDEMDSFMAGNYMEGHWTNRNSDPLDIGEDPDESESSEGSSSGYETDDGETTDEDLPPPQSIASTRSVFRRLSIDAADDDDGEYDSNRIRATLNRSRPRRRGPSLGSWVTDPSKPIAVIDSTGKRMVIYPALLPTETEQDTSDSSSSSSSSGTSRANIFAPGARLNRGGLVNPSEAFYPFINPDSDDSMGEMEQEDDNEDDDEIMLKIDDFIDFGDSDDEGDGDGEQTNAADVSSSKNDNNTKLTCALPKGNQREMSTQSLLDHLDQGVVTAFRRDQNRNKPFFSRPQLRDYITFGSTKSAIKTGRLAVSHPTTTTPNRKRRLSCSSDSSWAGFGASPISSSGHKRLKSY